MRTLLLLLYATLAIWMPHLIYFWITVMALCVAPFLFNPHQFSFVDYIIDYREFLRWMSRGNSRSHANSWIGYCRLSRTNITGFKKKRLGHPSEKLSADVPRASWRTVLFSEILFPIAYAALFVLAYVFVKSFPEKNSTIQASPLVRIAIVSLGPILWNAAVLLVMFLISIFLGPALGSCCVQFGSVMAFTAHVLGLMGELPNLSQLIFLADNTSLGMIGCFELLVWSSR
jgi:1,3-beta-glucan synthase